MQIHCKYDELVEIHSLRPYEKNRNRHSDEQIERLAFLLDKLGVRAPIVVAKAPYNCIAKGHGTWAAMKLNGWEKVPVVYQEFSSPEELYQFVQSDNAIAAWSSLDMTMIHIDIAQLGPFDTDLLGIQNFAFEPLAPPDSSQDDTGGGKRTVECPDCGCVFAPKK
jgi:hypothetical protein